MYHTFEALSDQGEPVYGLMRNVSHFGAASGELNGITIHSAAVMTNGTMLYCREKPCVLQKRMSEITSHAMRPSVAAFTWLNERLKSGS